MKFFCTYFDQNYLTKGLALYRSLVTHCPRFQLWALCLDQVTYNYLQKQALPGLHSINLADFERGDEALLIAKQNRSRVEYYFTCTSSLPLYIFSRHPEVDMITYLDADQFFFNDLEPIFLEIEDHSIAIISHRYPASDKWREQFGIYNVGWLSFKRDVTGLKCLNWWRERSLEWCYDRLEDDRYADQKYLDKWPQLFENLVVLQHKGANLALWNLANYALTVKNGQVFVDEDSLIFFHFHGFKPLKSWLYNPNFVEYKIKPSFDLLNYVYTPYIQTLRDITESSDTSLGDTLRRKEQPIGISLRIRQTLSLVKHTLTGRFVFFFRNRANSLHTNSRLLKLLYG